MAIKARAPAALPSAERIEAFIFRREPGLGSDETSSIFDALKDEVEKFTPEQWAYCVDLALECRHEQFKTERAFINRALRALRENAETKNQVGALFYAHAERIRTEMAAD